MIVFSIYFTQLNHRAVESFIKTSPDQWGTTLNIRRFCWMMLEAFPKKWYWFALSQEFPNPMLLCWFIIIFANCLLDVFMYCSCSQSFACGYINLSHRFSVGFPLSHAPSALAWATRPPWSWRSASCTRGIRRCWTPSCDFSRSRPAHRAARSEQSWRSSWGAEERGKVWTGSLHFPPGCSELNNFGLKNGVYWVYCFCFFLVGNMFDGYIVLAQSKTRMCSSCEQHIGMLRHPLGCLTSQSVLDSRDGFAWPVGNQLFGELPSNSDIHLMVPLWPDPIISSGWVPELHRGVCFMKLSGKTHGFLQIFPWSNLMTRVKACPA